MISIASHWMMLLTVQVDRLNRMHRDSMGANVQRLNDVIKGLSIDVLHLPFDGDGWTALAGNSFPLSTHTGPSKADMRIVS